MPTTVVTKTTGGKTRVMPMTVAAPEQQMRPEQLEQLAPDAQLNGRFLADLLSAFCAHERCGAHLYRTLAGATQNDEWRQKYDEFGRETVEHIGIYEDLIRQLGGDPMYVSPAARLTEYLDTKLMEPVMLTGSVDLKTTELAGLELVLLGETKCHGNWQLLSTLAEQLPDSDTKRAIQMAVQRVEPQEDEHLNWAKSTWQQAILAQLTQPR